MILCQSLDWDNETLHAMLPSPLYSPANREYQLAYMEGWNFTDLSFGIYRNGELVAAVLMTHGISPDQKEVLNWYGLPALCLQHDCLPKEAETLLKSSFLKIREAFADCRITLKEYPEEGISALGLSLLEHGAQCATTFYGVMNLTLPENDVWLSVRKSYRPLINKSAKTLRHEIISGMAATAEVFASFRDLHFAASGRATRNSLSWDRQMEMVQTDEAFLVMTYNDTTLIGASLYIAHGGLCYYGVGAYDRGLFRELPVAHGAIWKAALHARGLGCKKFILGNVFYPFQEGVVDAKEIAIGNFKKGFCTNFYNALTITTG